MEQRQKNPEEKQAADAAPAAAPSALEAYKAAHHGEAPPMTRGEKGFNGLSYWGLNGVVNAILSLFIADQVKHGHLMPVCRRLARKIGDPATSFLSLSSGGFALLIPLTLLENHKKWWVETLDKTFGKKNPTEEEQQEITARYEYLDREPKQTFASEFSARAIVTAIVYGIARTLSSEENVVKKIGLNFKGIEAEATGMAEARLRFLHNAELHPGIARKTAELETRLSKTPQAIAEKLAKAGRSEEFTQVSGKQRLHELLRLGYLEVFYTSIASSLQFLWTRLLAPFLGKKEAADPPPVSAQAASAAAAEKMTEVPVLHKNLSTPSSTLNLNSPPVRAGLLRPTSKQEPEKAGIAPASLRDRTIQPDAVGAVQL